MTPRDSFATFTPYYEQLRQFQREIEAKKEVDTQLAAIQQMAAADLARFSPDDIPHPAEIIREGREERGKQLEDAVDLH